MRAIVVEVLQPLGSSVQEDLLLEWVPAEYFLYGLGLDLVEHQWVVVFVGIVHVTVGVGTAEHDGDVAEVGALLDDAVVVHALLVHDVH